MNFDNLNQEFIQRYGTSTTPVRAFFAPGRVNLIGDHTDYSGGLVFPCAIDRGNAMLVRPRNDDTVQLASSNFDLSVSLSPAQMLEKNADNWTNYPLGIRLQVLQDGHKLSGFDCLFSGDVPNAAGLSSSAAIEIVTAYALNCVFDCGYDLLTLVKLAQRAENEFVGVQCGIMDQYAVAMAKPGKAMRLNCQTLDYEQVPLELGDYSIMLINSCQRRELSESKYNERVMETQQATALLKTRLDIQQLADVTPQQLDLHTGVFDNHSTVLKRARHVVTEQHRVITAVASLRAGDINHFGQLMNESHYSLRDDYEVSSKPLDTLVSIASSRDDVLGARLTGAGFGGCTVNLVRTDNLGIFAAELAPLYQQQTGLEAQFYPVTPSTGVHEVSLANPS